MGELRNTNKFAGNTNKSDFSIYGNNAKDFDASQV
jgi:hypothetical protein